MTPVPPMIHRPSSGWGKAASECAREEAIAGSRAQTRMQSVSPGRRLTAAARHRRWLQSRSGSRAGSTVRACHGLRSWLLPGHLDRRRGDGDGDEDDGAQPGEHLAVHGAAPLCPQLPWNIWALPGW